MATDPMWCVECFDEAVEYIDKIEAELEALRAENKSLKKDADRYRWLRDNSYVAISTAKQCLWIPRGVFEVPGKGFVEAIDAAMKGEKR